MRIALATPRYPPAVGGVEWYAYMLARELTRVGVAVDVVCTDPGARAPFREAVEGITVRRFPTLAGDPTFLLSPRLARWLVKHAAEYDLIHAYSYHTPIPVLGSVAAAARRVPFVVSPFFHGTGHTSARAVLHVPYRVAASWMLRRADAIVCVSEAESRALRVRFPRLPTVPMVIPCGVDTDELLAAGTVDTGGGMTVLGVGRLEPYKRMSRLVRAAAFLPRDNRLVIIGDGSQHDALRALATGVGLGGRFDSYTALPRDRLLTWYRSADVFVSMSAHESFGIAILEAAVTGTRVVASDIAAHREVAGFLPDGAVTLVPPGIGDEALAKTIVEAAERGRVHGPAANVPTWVDAARRTRAVYEAVLTDATGPGSAGSLPSLSYTARH
jgi:glycosyltransferase involved in cell wall biosynthesis